MGFREIKERSRRALHNAMKQPAAYYVDPDSTDDPFLIHVRPRLKENMTGDLAGTNLSYAQNHDQALKILFWREEVEHPVRGALVVFSAEEGYFVDSVELPDGLTVTAVVTKAGPDDLADRVLPNGAIVPSFPIGIPWSSEEW